MRSLSPSARRASTDLLSEVRQQLREARYPAWDSREWPGVIRASCPWCGAEGAPLSIRATRDRVLIRCREGCPTTSWTLAALGLHWEHLFAGEPVRHGVERRPLLATAVMGQMQCWPEWGCQDSLGVVVRLLAEVVRRNIIRYGAGPAMISARYVSEHSGISETMAKRMIRRLMQDGRVRVSHLLPTRNERGFRRATRVFDVRVGDTWLSELVSLLQAPTERFVAGMVPYTRPDCLDDLARYARQEIEGNDLTASFPSFPSASVRRKRLSEAQLTMRSEVWRLFDLGMVQTARSLAKQHGLGDARPPSMKWDAMTRGFCRASIARAIRSRVCAEDVISGGDAKAMWDRLRQAGQQERDEFEMRWVLGSPYRLDDLLADSFTQTCGYGRGWDHWEEIMQPSRRWMACAPLPQPDRVVA